MAEDIDFAFHMIPELAELNCCEKESVSAKCGVNVVWTAMSHRKQHIATTLVDVLRYFTFCKIIAITGKIVFHSLTFILQEKLLLWIHTLNR